MHSITKADIGPVHATRFEKIVGFVFENFDYITCIYLNCSQYAILTICIFFPTLTSKTFRMCERV